MASNADIASALIAKSKALVNNDLKKICKEEGQIQSGNKIALQQRVIQSMVAPGFTLRLLCLSPTLPNTLTHSRAYPQSSTPPSQTTTRNKSAGYATESQIAEKHHQPVL
jgi:hypothetical protein